MSIEVASVRALTIPSGRERDSVSDHTIRGRSHRRSSLKRGFLLGPDGNNIEAPRLVSRV